MADRQSTGQDAIDPADLVTLWQSELAAMAVDREAHEQLAVTATAWFTALELANASQRVFGHDGAPGRAGPDAAPGTPAGGPAAGPGGEPGGRCEP